MNLKTQLSSTISGYSVMTTDSLIDLVPTGYNSNTRKPLLFYYSLSTGFIGLLTPKYGLTQEDLDTITLVEKTFKRIYKQNRPPLWRRSIKYIIPIACIVAFFYLLLAVWIPSIYTLATH